MNAFLQMIKERDEEFLREALQINPELADMPDPNIEVTPLSYATRLKNSAAVVALLQAGADPDMIFKGRAALDVAAFNEAYACGDALLEFGADPNIRDEVGRTPLMTAARFGSLKMLDLLLSRGADARLADQHDRTALHWAMMGEHSDGLTAADYAQRMRLPTLLNELQGKHTHDSDSQNSV